MWQQSRFWSCAAVGVACFTVVAASTRPGAAQTADKGEQVMNLACVNCHDLRPIQTQALDAEGWNGVVAAMIERGATVDKADIPVLVNYLASTYGPLPEGAGKNILLNTCTVCHDLSRVKRTAASAEQWQEILSAMLNEGAMLSDEDFPVLLVYLARNFRSQ